MKLVNFVSAQRRAEAGTHAVGRAVNRVVLTGVLVKKVKSFGGRGTATGSHGSSTA